MEDNAKEYLESAYKAIEPEMQEYIRQLLFYGYAELNVTKLQEKVNKALEDCITKKIEDCITKKINEEIAKFFKNGFNKKEKILNNTPTCGKFTENSNYNGLFGYYGTPFLLGGTMGTFLSGCSTNSIMNIVTEKEKED